MAGPTAAESLIKAAAAGEGAREGGGERRKRWKEVGGSTGPRPPAQNRHALCTREPDPPRVRDQESQVDPGQGAMGMGFAKSPSCWTKGKNRDPGQKDPRGRPRFAEPSKIPAWRCLQRFGLSPVGDRPSVHRITYPLLIRRSPTTGSTVPAEK